jgi:UDP-glucose 4-epimerase
MFGSEIQMLPERKGNRMSADVVTAKTEALGWSPQRRLKEYIEEFRSNL